MTTVEHQIITDDETDERRWSCPAAVNDLTSLDKTGRLTEEEEEDGVEEEEEDGEEVTYSASSSSSFSRIRFALVQVHYHRIVLGDNPFCSEGPPISLGWERVESAIYHVVEFEEHRQRQRRTMDELYMSKQKRKRKLRRNGFNKSEIDERSNQVKAERKLLQVHQLDQQEQQQRRRERQEKSSFSALRRAFAPRREKEPLCVTVAVVQQ